MIDIETSTQLSNLGTSNHITILNSTLCSNPTFVIQHNENASGTQLTPSSTPSTLRNWVLAATAHGDSNTATHKPNRSLLNRFTTVVMPDIQDAYPTAVFKGINLDCLDKHDSIYAKILRATVDITQLQEVRVAAPVPNEDKNKPKVVPTTFLIYNLTLANDNFLLAYKVWSSIAITFRVTPLDLLYPNFVFTIKGFIEFANESILEMVQNAWLNNKITQGTADIITRILENDHKCTTVSIHSFLKSVWVKRLNIKDSSDSANPQYNVYANGSFISNNNLWMKLQQFLTNCLYSLYLQGKGTTKITPYTYSICHSTDHPYRLGHTPLIKNSKLFSYLIFESDL